MVESNEEVQYLDLLKHIEDNPSEPQSHKYTYLPPEIATRV